MELGRRGAFWEDGMAGSAKGWVSRSLVQGREPKVQGRMLWACAGARAVNGVGTAHASPQARLGPGQPSFPALSQEPQAGFPGPAELVAWPSSPPLPSQSPLPLGGPVVWEVGEKEAS